MLQGRTRRLDCKQFCACFQLPNDDCKTQNVIKNCKQWTDESLLSIGPNYPVMGPRTFARAPYLTNGIAGTRRSMNGSVRNQSRTLFEPAVSTRMRACLFNRRRHTASGFPAMLLQNGLRRPRSYRWTVSWTNGTSRPSSRQSNRRAHRHRDDGRHLRRHHHPCDGGDGPRRWDQRSTRKPRFPSAAPCAAVC